MSKKPFKREIILTEEQKNFYAKLKVGDISNISEQKIAKIRELALTFFEDKQLAKYEFYSRWLTATLKAYDTLKTENLSFGIYGTSQVYNITIEYDAEILLFIMFVTDPSFLLFDAAKNKATIAETQAYCNKYIGFWDLKLFVLEQKYLKLADERKMAEIQSDLKTHTGGGRKTL